MDSGFKKPLDKKPSESKKFWAFVLSHITWTAGLCLVLRGMTYKLPLYETLIVLSLILADVIVQVGYILGQAAVDRVLLRVDGIIDSARGVENKTEEKPAAEEKSESELEPVAEEEPKEEPKEEKPVETNLEPKVEEPGRRRRRSNSEV